MMKISKNLNELAQIFNRANANLYIVGGAVRNFLLKQPYYDIDICSNLAIDDVIEILSNTKYLVKIKNALTQTAQIICDNEVYEYARFRQEEYSEQGNRVPSKITFVGSIQEDYTRRDFTCNSIYYDIINRKIIDYAGGKADIENKILKTTLAPEKTLSYDALRLLRLLRFSLEYNLTIDEDVKLSAKANAHLLLKIKGQTKKEELYKIIRFGTEAKDYYENNYKKLYALITLNYLPYLFAPKLKKIQFNAIDIKEIFPLSLNCNNSSLALTCFIVDLYTYILSKQIFIDKEIVELLLGTDGLALSNKEISYYSKLCSAYTFDKIVNQPRFYIYINNEIIDDIITIFSFNNNYKIKINAIKTEIKQIKHKKLPLNAKDLAITSKDVYDLNLGEKKNINFILKQVHYAVLFEQVRNDKQELLSFILKKLK